MIHPIKLVLHHLLAHHVLTLGMAVVMCCPATGQEQNATGSGGGASATENYQAKLANWKAALKNMRSLQLDYVEADPSQMGEIEQRWQELVADGEHLLQELREAGVAAYVEAPGKDRELERFLVKILDDTVSHDRYEAASELSQALIENGCEVNEVFDLAGVAAFVLNDFERAEKHLSRAAAAGAVDKGTDYVALIPQYKEYWKAEQALREEEAKSDLPRVKLTTTKGDVVIELFENEAPETVGNFVNLILKGFYDGLIFHRVLPGFMAQGGCPLGTGEGGPGYNIYCECVQPNHRKHFRGSLSMAKQKPRDTGGSQFFLTFRPTANLNGDHTVFGRIIEGMEVLAELQRIDPGDAKKPKPDLIEKAEVLRKRDHEYVPNKVD
jgi:cyclophilin family peptidyl-prolyl cis-trans isomerase